MGVRTGQEEGVKKAGGGFKVTGRGRVCFKEVSVEREEEGDLEGENRLAGRVAKGRPGGESSTPYPSLIFQVTGRTNENTKCLFHVNDTTRKTQF